MVGILDRGLARAGRPNRSRAVAIAALCVGGMVVARGVDNRAFADEIRDATMRAALSLGHWSKPRARAAE